MPNCRKRSAVMKLARQLSAEGLSRSDALKQAWIEHSDSGKKLCKKSKKRSGKRKSSKKRKSPKKSSKRKSPKKSSKKRKSRKKCSPRKSP